MTYRTKTYIAADWTGDNDAVEQLHKWNDSNYWGLSFHDAHDITQSSDSSKNCSIKASLRSRFDVSKTFVLIVGNGTKSRRAGECNYCFKNNECGSTSNKSFIEYECDKAVRDNLKIVVLYNAATIDKTKCPDAVKNIGIHTAMCYRKDSKLYWDYQAVKNAVG
ncbi:hypothetical protein SAMN02745163_03763 [Clostridium cavendishii DSM 21758]|uniref:Thoeris protein ThsB TIR-like domain-containing protein n=1 Tax=Clostridium cavendishii DSM 21758 TaxID=1121302 RepID=A0A1M6SBA4_9CLOT|nr:hypothetical protein SAMN02745163_03763 [Clostridium cavendishii DSM 21758]